MSKLNIKPDSITGKEKAEKLVKVEALVSFGISITEACRRENLPRITYYREKAKREARAEAA